MKHNLKKGDWIYNKKHGYISKITSFDSNGINVLMEGGNIRYKSEIGAIADCTRFFRANSRMTMEKVMDDYTKMFKALQQISGVYDWEEDLAGKVSHETLTNITGKIFS